jgi:hypothetical protein
MKTKIFFGLFGLLIILQSCTKENCTHSYEGITYKAVYAPMSALRNISIQPAKAITGNGKIFIKGNYIFLNEVDKGFHIIDNTNPSAPQGIAFVSIPGNLDMIAKGNYLLVDNYIDLLTFDISNPASIQLVKRTENALPYRQYNYGFSDNANNGIIISFDKKVEKMEMDCNSNGFVRFDNGAVFLALSSFSDPSKSLGGANGQAGSLSRFATAGNYLYIANRYSITPIDISSETNPIVKPAAVQNFGEFETLYSFNNSLFVGSPTGMFILSLANPAVPAFQSAFSHWRGCDPVVVQNDIAYVTVRGGGACGGERNTLDVINVSNLSQPQLIKTYQLENPFGLGIFNNKLGICDGAAGFKIYNVSNNSNLQLESIVSNINALDVIMNDERALLVAKDGMYQYNIINGNAPVLLSKISINQ